MFDRMVPEFHSMMERFRELIMNTRTTPGVPDEHRRLHELLMFLEFRLFSYVKCFDESLGDEDPANFYMEREWRVVGNVQFELNDVRRVLIPSVYAVRFRAEIPEYYGQITFAD
jgi:abortive phage resistance protein AbiGi (putative antitoxin)